MGGSSSCVAWNVDWGPRAEATLVAALSKLGIHMHELPSQRWDPSTSTIGGVRDYMCTHVGPGGPGWSIALLELDATFYEALARELSLREPVSVMTFSELDQSAWGYTLWQKGQRLDVFWNDPELVDQDAGEVRGNAKLVADACGVDPSAIAPYLQPRNDDSASAGRVHPDDEFELDDHWVRTDLMRRLGIGYPDVGRAPGRHVRLRGA